MHTQVVGDQKELAGSAVDPLAHPSALKDLLWRGQFIDSEQAMHLPW